MPITQRKSKEILRHGEVGGRPLTKPQRGFFGARAGGLAVRGLKKNPNAAKRRLNRLNGRIGIQPRKKLKKPKKREIVSPPIRIS